jgi:hypothetical protein
MQTKVTVVPGLSKREIEQIALSLLQEIQPQALTLDVAVDVESLYEFYIPEKCGIETGYTDLSGLGPGILGYTDAVSMRSSVDKTLSDSTEGGLLRRFRATVGHESFHCMKHVQAVRYFRSTSHGRDEALYRVERTKVRPFEDPEWQSWRFARAYLMPMQRIRCYSAEGLSPHQMAEIFDLNPAFVEVRLKNLGLETK